MDTIVKPWLLQTTLALGALCAATTSAAQSAASAAAAASKPLFAVEFRTGPAWNPALPPGQQAYMREHSANLKKLRDEGRIRIGARYGEVGLVVLEAATIDEARAWIEADPAVKSGTFRFELHPFGVFYGGTVQR